MKHRLPDHDCSTFVQKVFLVLDGELTDEEKAEFVEDIERCKTCLNYYNIEKQLKDFVAKKFERKGCSEELKKQIIEKIKQIEYSE